jgi:hypothetical protein
VPEVPEQAASRKLIKTTGKPNGEFYGIGLPELMESRCKTGKKILVKPSKHDVLAQVHHFLQYTDDFMTGHSQFDRDVYNKKRTMLKDMLHQVED